MQRPILLTALFVITAVAVASVTSSQEAATAPVSQSSGISKSVIVPLVTIKPGEEKELMLSTWCRVGATRGGGFGVTEIRDGNPVTIDNHIKSYSRDGITITVPTFDEGVKLADLPEYGALRAQGIQPFKVKIVTSANAKPGVLEMHLADYTCSGDCDTDFRVLVMTP